MTEIGAKRFWNWLYAKIVETFPTRNYNRVIPVPPYKITLPVLDQLNIIVQRTISERMQDKIHAIKNELHIVRGLLDTEAKTDEIDDRLSDIINKDKHIANLTKKLKRAVRSVFKIDVD